MLFNMHYIVRGKNVTHIQRALTERCCIMLDDVDRLVLLMARQQQGVQIKRCSKDGGGLPVRNTLTPGEQSQGESQPERTLLQHRCQI